MRSLVFVCFFMVISTNAFSKYGRSCKDIGCLNSEVCVLVEDPCSYGRTSDCGMYPTCKRKTAADGGGETHNEPAAKPTTPKPIAELKPQPQPPRYDDSAPNYPPPAPPRGSSYGNTHGGGSYPSNGGSNYPSNGGSNYPNNGGSSSGSFPNPFSAFGFGSNTGGSGSNGGNPLTSILSNFLSNFTKGIPSFNPSFTRPGLIENNRNSNPSNPYGNPSNPYGNPSNPYPSYPNNGQAGQGQYYPSYHQPSNSQAGQPTQQNGYYAKNYGQSHAGKNVATTRSPSLFGWHFGAAAVLFIMTKFYVRY